ncbi:MAG: SurA N-terminal domain-containing protein [Candidatus Accumulibacter sp.]|jgi:peptidyl-prolyl cis-trans isomerase D|nr:SurA N-terminal domain-containing protein [Accumulibacter sp.]
MFDAIRNNKRIVQIFLGVITLPFAFFGIDYMQNIGAGSDLASVGDTKISYYQFEQALRERQNQLRRSMGEAFKAEMMNSPQVRLGILNDLIDERLLLLEAVNNRLAASNQTLQAVIANEPAWQENGVFSKSRYEAVLRAQGMSPEQYEAGVRQQMTLRQLIGTVGASAFVSATQAEAMLRIQTEERKFNEFTIAAAPFAEKLKIEPETVQKFYDENKQRFEVPEQVKAEYVVLSLDALMSQVTVSEAQIKSWYEDDSHKDLYRQPEERRASHILIAPGDDGDKEKAKARAEAVLKDVRQNPSRFADLAKQHSQDPGSAEKGGDLGFFSSGAMVKPFDDAVFSQKEGEISGLVETNFGYHIIKVTSVREEKRRPLEEVRGEIEAELKRQAASRQFAESAETFSNLVYEQSDSLQPAADQFKLKIEQTGWLPKNADPQARAALGPLDNDKVLTALFSEDAVRNKRNTEAVEVAPNTLLAARVLEHAAATIRPFDAVRDDIEKMLRDEEAMKQATGAGEARLAELRKGEDQVAWSETRGVSRQQATQSPLPAAALQAIFKADVQKLPAYVGVGVGDGYTLFRITEVAQPEKIDENQLKALKDGYAGIVAREDVSAYLSSLRSRYKIDINQSLLENRERQ